MGLKPLNNEFYLLNRIAQNDEIAFEEIFMAYHQQIGEYVYLLTNSQAHTEDIVQEVFMKVWLSREKLSEIANFSGYLFILTRNHTLNCLRQIEQERKRYEDYTEVCTNQENMGQYSQNQGDDYLSRVVLVNKAIARLPLQQQKVFTLRLQGLKNPEIATQMQISTDSVKKYQQWALKSVSGFVKNNTMLSIFMISYPPFGFFVSL